MISDFVEGCGFERPFHLVVIDARGTTSVTRYGDATSNRSAAARRRRNRLRMLAPLIGHVHLDGRLRQGGRRSRSSAARETMQ